MTWWDAAPAAAVAVLLLVVPGLVLSGAAGVRGVLGVALAPVQSVGVVALSAVAGQVVGVRWGWPVVLMGVAVGSAGMVLLRVGLRRWAARPGTAVSGDGPAVWLASALGVLAGGASLVVGFVQGVGGVTRWPQTFDAVFHLSASWHVLTTGDGSSLTLGTLTAPGATRGFYPAAWHDLVAVVAGVADVPVAVASNVLSAAVLGVAWPLGAVALTRAAFGARPVALAAAGAVAAGVTASPVLLAAYGTLWPNELGTALLPGAGALLVVLLGPADRAVVGRAPVVALLGVALIGLGLAHPNVVVSLLVLGVGAAVVAASPVGGRRRWLAVAAVPVTAWLVGWSPVFAATRGTSWPARESVAQALGEWVLLSPQRIPTPLVVAVLAVVGAVVGWRRPGLRWLVAAHVVGGGVFALVAGSDGTLARLAGGPWYDDAFRLAALAGVTGVPLAALGVDAVVERLGRLVARLPRMLPTRAAAVPGVVVLLTLGLVTGGLSWSATRTVTAWWYRYSSILDPGETALLERLPGHVPAGGVVAGNPFDGAAESGAVGGRRPLFPHLTGRWDTDRVLVGAHLAEAGTRPDVCAAVRRLGVTHVLTGAPGFWTGDPRRRQYDGLAVAGRPGFVRVDSSGGTDLWRITACTV